MGILTDARPVGIICVHERERARAFYRDVLGLKLVREDSFAAIFGAGAISIRVSTVSNFVPHDHTVMGFVVPDMKRRWRRWGRTA